MSYQLIMSNYSIEKREEAAIRDGGGVKGRNCILIFSTLPTSHSTYFRCFGKQVLLKPVFRGLFKKCLEIPGIKITTFQRKTEVTLVLIMMQGVNTDARIEFGSSQVSERFGSWTHLPKRVSAVFTIHNY